MDFFAVAIFDAIMLTSSQFLIKDFVK